MYRLGGGAKRCFRSLQQESDMKCSHMIGSRSAFPVVHEGEAS